MAIANFADSDRWSAVCRGATLWGLEDSAQQNVGASKTVTSRVSRYSYGHAWDVPYQTTDRVKSTGGVVRATEQVGWIVNKVGFAFSLL